MARSWTRSSGHSLASHVAIAKPVSALSKHLVGAALSCLPSEGQTCGGGNFLALSVCVSGREPRAVQQPAMPAIGFPTPLRLTRWRTVCVDFARALLSWAPPRAPALLQRAATGQVHLEATATLMKSRLLFQPIAAGLPPQRGRTTISRPVRVSASGSKRAAIRWQAPAPLRRTASGGSFAQVAGRGDPHIELGLHSP